MTQGTEFRAWWRVLLIPACAAFTASCGRVAEGPADHGVPGPASTVAQPAKMLLAHYMPWYETPAERGYWGRHWTGHQAQHDPDGTGEDGLPDIWSRYHPLIGPYDSADPDALECHLLQMKLAGIDGVIVDWYGIGQTDDHPPIHQATRAMFDAAGRFGMKFAVCFEDRTVDLLIQRGKLPPDGAADHLAETLQWVQDTWFTRPQYAHFRGRPLFLNFGPMTVTNASTWAAAFKPLPLRPAFYPLHHLWKPVDGDGGFLWVHHDPWEGTPSDARIRERIGEVFTYFSTNAEEVIVSAYPGFDDVYEPSMPDLPHRDGATLRETLEVAMAGPWPVIQLVTWNDYGEGTMVEPTHEFGYTFLEAVQEARRRERGEVFPYTSDDLKLPARLYAARKEGASARAELDRIAGLLREGRCRPAREALDGLETGR